MNTIFFIYPHCHINSTDKELLVYDTLSGKHVYLKKNPLTMSDKDSLQMGYLIVSEKHNDFINLCLANELGYFIDFTNVPPFFCKRDLEFVTSLAKERKALGYNLASYTNLLLRTITIYCNNSSNKYSEEMCLQMEYPKRNNNNIDIDFILHQLTNFQHIVSIVLSGELKTSSLSSVLEYAKERNIFVTHRLLCDSFLNNFSMELFDKYNYSIELLVDCPSDIEQINAFSNDRIYIKAIIQSIADIPKYEVNENFCYLPVLSSNRDNTEILQQMILSVEDILYSSKTINDCRLLSYINPDIFGHLTIEYDGSVSCQNNKIASIYEFDLSFIVNRWIGNNKCTWYNTRRKKDICKDCALQCLCPPISIYEELHFYKCPCAI